MGHQEEGLYIKWLNFPAPRVENLQEQGRSLKIGWWNYWASKTKQYFISSSNNFPCILGQEIWWTRNRAAKLKCVVCIPGRECPLHHLGLRYTCITYLFSYEQLCRMWISTRASETCVYSSFFSVNHLLIEETCFMNHALYCMGDPSEDIYCQHYQLYERKYKNQQQDLILNSVFLEINNWCISTTFI